MFERVRYGGRDPEAWLRGCAAAVLLFVGFCTWLLGAVAMFGLSWLMVWLRALVAWLLMDPSRILVEPLLFDESAMAAVELAVEPLLYDATDDLARLAGEPPPAIPAPPLPPEPTRLVEELAMWSTLHDVGVIGMLVSSDDRAYVLGARSDGSAFQEVLSMGVLSNSSMEGRGDEIGGLIGVSGGVGRGGLGTRGTGLLDGATVEGLGGLGTLGSGGASARVVKRTAPRWGELDAALAGRSCRVAVEVREGQFYRIEEWNRCPNALRRPIEAAIDGCTFSGSGTTILTFRTPD